MMYVRVYIYMYMYVHSNDVYETTTLMVSRQAWGIKNCSFFRGLLNPTEFYEKDARCVVQVESLHFCGVARDPDQEATSS